MSNAHHNDCVDVLQSVLLFVDGEIFDSAQIANIVRAMAVERDQDLAELATALSVNAERIFGSFAP